VYADALEQSEAKVTKLEALVHEHEAELKASAAVNHELKSEIRSLQQGEAIAEPSTTTLSEIEESYKTVIADKDRLANLKESENKRMKAQIEKLHHDIEEAEKLVVKARTDTATLEDELAALHKENVALNTQLKSEAEKLRSFEFELISERKLSKRLSKDLKQIKSSQEAKKRDKKPPMNMSLMDELNGLATEPNE
jgi:chromosome segregation ATPase